MEPVNSGSNFQMPLVPGSIIRNNPDDIRRRAIARRLTSKNKAVEQGKIKNDPDTQVSLENT
jgi:hypothetical protein